MSTGGWVLTVSGGQEQVFSRPRKGELVVLARLLEAERVQSDSCGSSRPHDR